MASMSGRSMNIAKAQAEYERLCALIGSTHPHGDCQLVALMVARAIDGRIIEGDVTWSDGSLSWHFWAVTVDRHPCDPLGQAKEHIKPQAYQAKRTVKESEILSDLRTFVGAIEYIPHCYEPIFPLRYLLTKDLIGVEIPDISNIVLKGS